MLKQGNNEHLQDKRPSGLTLDTSYVPEDKVYVQVDNSHKKINVHPEAAQPHFKVRNI